MSLQGNLQIIKLLSLQNPHMLQSRLHQCLCRYAAVLRQEHLIQGTGIDADADGNMPLLGRLHHSLDIFLATDVARVQAQGRNPLPDGFQCQAVIKVDIRH